MAPQSRNPRRSVRSSSSSSRDASRAASSASPTRRKAKQVTGSRNPRVAAHSASLHHIPLAGSRERSATPRRGKLDASHVVGTEEAVTKRPSVKTAQDVEYERLKSTGRGSHARASQRQANLDEKAIDTARAKRKKKRIIIGVCVSILAVCLIGLTSAFAYVYSINKNLQYKVDDALLSVLSPVDTPTDPFYVLLLGTDGSAKRMAEDGLDEGGYRSDSMMLARIDPKNKKAAIISIPRDTLVEIKGQGKQKINAALFYGGPSLAVQTVSSLAGVPIAHYAEVNFDGFSAMVDTLGGVEVDVPIAINDNEAGGSLQAGRQTLNGQGALILCRTRHTYDKYGAGDLYRAANQRMVLSAIAQKMLSVDPLSLGKSVSTLSQYVTTDLDVQSIVGIAQSMRGIDATQDIYSAVAPTTSEYKGGGWYEILDATSWKEMISRMDQGLPPVIHTDAPLQRKRFGKQPLPAHNLLMDYSKYLKN